MRKTTNGITPEQLEAAAQLFGSSEFGDYDPMMMSDDDADVDEDGNMGVSERFDQEEGGEDDQIDEQRARERKFKLYQQTFEPSALAENFITPMDEIIKAADMPERLKLRHQNRYTGFLIS